MIWGGCTALVEELSRVRIDGDKVSDVVEGVLDGTGGVSVESCRFVGGALVCGEGDGRLLSVGDPAPPRIP